MTKLNYSESSILDEAWKLIDQHQTLEIVITGWRAKPIARVFPHYLGQSAPQRSRLQRRLSLLKFTFLGAFCAPTLWGICARATIAGMLLEGFSVDNSFVVRCILTKEIGNKTTLDQ